MIYYKVDTKKLHNNVETINISEFEFLNHLKLPKETKSIFLFKSLEKAMKFKINTINNNINKLSKKLMTMRTNQYNTIQILQQQGISYE